MRYIVLATCIQCLLLSVLDTHAQQTLQVKFDHITTDDGLSQGMVNSIIQDKYGFMWFASNDGLNRYDGNSFTVYKNDPNDNNSIAENFIRYLFEDSKGRIWIATAGNGLDLFDRETETFIHFKHRRGTNSISDNSVTSIDEDRMGGIWVGTLHGLNLLTIGKRNGKAATTNATRDATERFLQSQSVDFRKIVFDPNQPQKEFYSRDAHFPLADWRASNFHIDAQGHVWISTQAKLFHIKPDGKAGYKPDSLDIKAYLPRNSENTVFEKYIQDFIPGRDSSTFYMLFQSGITEVNSISKKIKVISTTHVNNGIYSFPSVLDNSGSIWTCDEFVTECFNTNTKEWELVSAADKNLSSILRDVSCSYKDKTGNIWLGTKGYGLLKYDPAKKSFNKTGDSYIRFMTAGARENMIFIKDPYDQLFWEFDRRTNAVRVPVPLSAFSKDKYRHIGTTTKSVLQDSDGSYWIGRVALYHYEPAAGGKITEYWDNYDDVFPLYDDGRNSLWFGNTNGIVQFNKLTGLSTEYTFPTKTTMGPYDYLQAIYRDKEGILWLGTLGGLYRFELDKQQWTQYQNIAGNPKSLNNNLIFCICPDPVEPDRYLWIGTKGGGLNRFDQQNETFIHYTEKDGLSNDVIYGILPDASGDLWLSTNKGLSRFIMRQSKFKNYNVNDGLQGNEYNRNAFCKTKDEYLYFGGITGFNFFNPAKLEGSSYIPTVLITGISVLNKPLDFRGPDAILQKPAYLTESLSLLYEENMISFQFAATDFSAVHNNQFEYRLLGFDKDWIRSGANRIATYTNLDPGEYTFEVKGSNSNGVWNQEPTRLILTILPPWYLTWGFKILAVVALSSLIYGIHRYRLAKILQLQKVRNSIAGDLHDEVGSNLSAIAVFSDLASNPKKPRNEVDSLLEKISTYTRTSQDSMSDIVWMIDTKNDRLGSLRLRMQSFASELLEAGGASLHFVSAPALDEVKLTMLQRKTIYLVFKEAVHNIVKYADAKKIIVELKQEDKMIRLSVSDDGNGFNVNEYPNKLSKGGNGLENMKRRAASIKGKMLVESSTGHGSTISLLFPA